MARNNSETEIAGRLGASLTPRVPRITTQQRGEQSSGLFDIGALYAASVEQVMRRSRAVREPSIRHVADVAVPAPGSWPRAIAPVAAPFDEIDIEPDMELFMPAPRIGWFGVAVAWLATTAIGATLATTVPAHAFARGHTASPPAATPVVAAVSAPALVAAPASAPPASATAPAPVSTPAPALAPAVAPASAPALASTPRKKTTITPHAHATPVARSATTEAAAPAPQPQKAQPQRAAPAADSPAPKVATPSPPPPAGGSSLEDLMRRAVEADAKHH